MPAPWTRRWAAGLLAADREETADSELVTMVVVPAAGGLGALAAVTALERLVIRPMGGLRRRGSV
jgi:hypothetical protein